MSPTAAPQSLTSAEIQRARTHLEQTAADLAASVQPLSDAQLHFTPAPGQWSIAGNLEHCVIIQEVVLSRVREQLAATAPGSAPESAAVEDLIWNRFHDRSAKFNAPEFVQPTGQRTVSECLTQLHQNNARFIEWLETGGASLRERCIPSPPLMAVTQGALQFMDAYQWILTVASHNRRHTLQIAEVKAAPEFPAA